MTDMAQSAEPRSGLAGWIADLHLALVFLTRLPMPPLPPRPSEALAQAMRCFPLVGLAVGLAGGVVFALARDAVTPLAAGLMAVAVMALLTGGLHEDGLADTADGLGGGRDRDHVLAILRDSRIGSYGALALILGVGLRAAALAGAADATAGLAAVVAAATLSRGLIPAAMTLSRPARDDGLGAGAGRPRGGETLSALAIAAVVATLCLGLGGAVVALACAVAAGGAVLWAAHRRIGGYTGDILGAVQQAAEIAVLLAAVAAR